VTVVVLVLAVLLLAVAIAMINFTLLLGVVLVLMGVYNAKRNPDMPDVTFILTGIGAMAMMLPFALN
jgi:hypothetical membrane protein